MGLRGNWCPNRHMVSWPGGLGATVRMFAKIEGDSLFVIAAMTQSALRRSPVIDGRKD